MQSDFAPLPFQEDEDWTKGINYFLSYRIFVTGPDDFTKEGKDRFKVSRMQEWVFRKRDGGLEATNGRLFAPISLLGVFFFF